MKKIVAFILTICLLISMLFAGCSSKNELEGCWRAEIDFSEILNEYFKELEFDKYVTIRGFCLGLFADFNNDGTYEIKVDADEAATAWESVREDVKKGFTKYVEDEIRKTNVDITVDELLERNGTSLDASVEELIPDALLQSYIDGLTCVGNYEVKEGKLYMSDSLDAKPTEENGEEYTVNETTLTIFSSDTESAGEPDLFPLVFKKVK